MKDLRLVDTEVVSSLEDISSALYLTVDSDLGTVYVATPTQLVAFSPALQEVQGLISLDNASDTGCEPVGLQYLSDQQAACVATVDGRLCLWQMDSPEIECVGEVEQGLTSMAWSPDLELLVLTTGEANLILMTREFDPLTEVSMFTTEPGEECPVSVGWGKKETQFHGSVGKQAAKAELVLVSPASPGDNGRPTVRWRGDGQFFVVSAIEPSSGGRFLYVWSREGVLQSRSEPVDGLRETLAWKPSGSLIASVQHLKHLNSQQVVFFEKNGLRHGEFPIPDSAREDFMVKTLVWSQDSTVLALWIDLPQGSTLSSQVQLWTVGNYHWYLKQTLDFPLGLSAVDWHPEVSHRLCLVTTSGQYLTYTWTWHICATPGHRDTDPCTVAVTDGVLVLMTPMRWQVVPPPMCAYSLRHPCPVNAVSFLHTPVRGPPAMAALLCDNSVALWDYQHTSEDGVKCEMVKLDAAGGDGFTSNCHTPSFTGLVRITGLATAPSYPLAISHLTWCRSDLFVFTTVGESGSTSVLHFGQLRQQEGVIAVSSSVVLESRVVSVAVSCHSGTGALQLANGQLLKLHSDPPNVSPWVTHSGTVLRFPYLCRQIAVTQLAGEEVVLGLTDRFRLYVNTTEVASNCTSFGVHKDFLLLTTLSHTVRCLSKTVKVSELPKLSEGKAHPFDESVRRVERGSSIVTVVADDTKLVLQMPRGNLETVHPRALVLATLKDLLDRRKISEAFVLMRKHRINMNLLHDHNPREFMANVEDVISQVQSVNHLNLFLTDLIEEDVTRTMYTASYPTSATGSCDSQAAGPRPSKVDTVCDAFIQAFRKMGENRYLLSILTALVRKRTPELEQALLLVWSLHGASSRGEVTAEEALKYLVFLVDVNTLYEVALGTYNFDLVIMVAEKSHKDPKEYIPFLNQLRSLEETYRHFTIDNHLKRYNKALESISKCGDEHFEECVSLVCEHKLYRKALQLYKPGTPQYKCLAALYGNYLKSKNRHEEAGIMYSKAEDWLQALEAFRACSEWRQVFFVAAKLGYEANKLMELAVKVAGELRGRQRYAEAATVYEEYAQDPEEAVAALLEGWHWEESLRVMSKHGRLDLVETHLSPALEEAHQHLMDGAASQRDLFTRHRARLLAVRTEKARVLLDGAGEYNDADGDLFSDTSSLTGGSVASLRSYNSSRSTVFTKTSGSSRTRRKAENKKWSLKEGSVHEEFALVDALGKLVKSVDAMKESVSSVMKCLIQFHHDTKAHLLQETYSDFLTDIQASLTQIWSYSQPTSGPMNLGPGLTSSAIAQAVQSGLRPPLDQDTLDPVLLVAPTLSKDLRWKLHMAGDQDR